MDLAGNIMDCLFEIERFLHDLDMTTHEKNGNDK